MMKEILKIIINLISIVILIVIVIAALPVLVILSIIYAILTIIYYVHKYIRIFTNYMALRNLKRYGIYLDLYSIKDYFERIDKNE